MAISEGGLDCNARAAIAELRDRWGRKKISDVTDADGNQYVDLVLEGGGMLGIGLAGYTYALEQVGIRFRSIAGTSAGAINAALLAALGPAHKPKSLDLAVALANMPAPTFLDGGIWGNWLLRCLIRNPGRGWYRLVVPSLLAFLRLLCHRGLLRGSRFQSWLSGHLGHKSWAGLMKDFRSPPDGLPDFDPRLAIIAADITTETKAVFDAMAHLYFYRPDLVDPALIVRASISLPFVFEPVPVEFQEGLPSPDEWKERLGLDFGKKRLKKVDLVDGGVVSNFPIDQFHVAGEPRMPTFGVRLGLDRQKINPTGRLRQFAMALMNTALGVTDDDFINQNPDYRELVGYVKTGGASAADIYLTPDEQIGLFLSGVEGAREFLLGKPGSDRPQGFDWGYYQALRTGRCTPFIPEGAGVAVGAPETRPAAMRRPPIRRYRRRDRHASSSNGAKER